MHVATAAFLVIVLFVIHEFEEIIRVLPWIDKNKDNPKYLRDTWISRKESYPTTEFIALMIGEEIILVSVLLFIAILIDNKIIIIAIAIINSLHLVSHLIFGIRICAWNPGSITSLITLPMNIVVITLLSLTEFKIFWMIIITFVLGILFVLNLKVLHRIASNKKILQ
jgi:hypothetical protein